MPLYYRIQPAGLSIAGHRSETSAGNRPHGIDVFDSALGTLHADVGHSAYGDELIVIAGGPSWPNHDVEGVRIDPEEASIIARFSWPSWIALLAYLGDLPTEWDNGSLLDEGELEDDLRKLDLDALDAELERALTV